MIKPIVRCPKCGSKKTREWQVGVPIYKPEYISGFNIFDDDSYNTLKNEFGKNEKTQEDYYCAKNICDDCDCRFATKNKITISVLETIVFENYTT